MAHKVAYPSQEDVDKAINESIKKNKKLLERMGREE